jgi:hypothetical protein
MEPEMYDYTSNNWSHRNSIEKLKEKPGSCTKKTFDRFTTKDSYTWNITHNMESGESPLFQEKYHEEKACDKRHPYNNNNNNNNNNFILHYEKNVIFRNLTFRNDSTKIYRLYVM